MLWTKRLEKTGKYGSCVAILCVATAFQLAGFANSASLGSSRSQGVHDYLVYVGTYTSGDSKGIYGFRFHEKSGTLQSLGLEAAMANPSFIVTDPTHRHLYAVTEMTKRGPNAYRENGTISSFAIDPRTGSLRFLNRVSSGGGGPCHLVVDRRGRILFVANYGSGNVASFSIRPDGGIGAMTGFDQHHGSSLNPRRQGGPHAHEVVLSADNRFLFVPDLGLDRIMIYRVNEAKRSFSASDPAYVPVKPGLGPRHFILAPGGKFAYAVCEMGSSVVAFSFDRTKGALTPIQTISTLPASFTGEDNSAEIQIDARGRFLYASNRGQNTLTEFRIDGNSGMLAPVQNVPSGGKTPRNFVIDPTGRYVLVANQDSNNIVLFKIDPATGRLTAEEREYAISAPVSILFIHDTF